MLCAWQVWLVVNFVEATIVVAQAGSLVTLKQIGTAIAYAMALTASTYFLRKPVRK